MTKQTRSQSNLKEGNQAADKRLSSREESPVLNAISAHLEKWYPTKIEPVDKLVDVVERSPVGLNPPYESERAA